MKTTEEETTKKHSPGIIPLISGSTHHRLPATAPCGLRLYSRSLSPIHRPSRACRLLSQQRSYSQLSPFWRCPRARRENTAGGAPKAVRSGSARPGPGGFPCYSEAIDWGRCNRLVIGGFPGPVQLAGVIVKERAVLIK